MKKPPIAPLIRLDKWGASCALCLGVVLLDRFAKGEPVYRHVEYHPVCQPTANR